MSLDFSPKIDLPFSHLNLYGRRCLLAASTGGHLAQLTMISEALALDPTSVLFTFPGSQSSALSERFDVRHIPYIPPRGFAQLPPAAWHIGRALASGKFDGVISTGAGIALAALPLATARGIPAHYIESYSRSDGPSMTGRILARSPGVRTWTQHESWRGERWRYAGDVLQLRDMTAPVRRPRTGPPKIFVTLGTIKPYRFDALIDKVKELAPAGAEFVWQVGATGRSDLPGTVWAEMDSQAFDEAVLGADIVVSHGGTGTALRMLELGHTPLLIPRRAVRHEHVDDHQLQICRNLGQRGLAHYREVSDLTAEDLVAC